jgi:lipopolysaccharide biosynthesis glycosyltransferase
MFRYAIAEIFGEGFAIYLDVDMLLVSDIAELWGYRKHGEWRCLQDGSTEVMVIDCAVRNGVPPIGQLMRLKKNQVHPKLNPAIPLEWNCEDSAPDGAKLIHFTDLKRQPWNVARNDDAAKVWHDCAAMCR